MEDEPFGEGYALILGRPFFITAKSKIDIHARTLSMEFGDTYVNFNIFEELKHLAEDHSIFVIDPIDGHMEGYFGLGTSGANIDEVLKTSQYAKIPVVDTSKSRVKRIADRAKSDSKGKKPANTDSKMQEPTETKLIILNGAETLPPTNRKSDLIQVGGICLPRDRQQFPVIIANNLNIEQEEKFLEVLKKHKKAISWTLVDLSGINPSICMHKILLEEDAHPISQKEVTKPLAARMIYPISDSQWVSLVQVVPKKFGMMVIKNWQDKMEAKSSNSQRPLSVVVIYKFTKHLWINTRLPSHVRLVRWLTQGCRFDSTKLRAPSKDA
ncbi:hypothetical protein CR513_05893, partial [Mucuna pruriens]